MMTWHCIILTHCLVASLLCVYMFSRRYFPAGCIQNRFEYFIIMCSHGKIWRGPPTSSCFFHEECINISPRFFWKQVFFKIFILLGIFSRSISAFLQWLHIVRFFYLVTFIFLCIYPLFCYTFLDTRAMHKSAWKIDKMTNKKKVFSSTASWFRCEIIVYFLMSLTKENGGSWREVSKWKKGKKLPTTEKREKKSWEKWYNGELLFWLVKIQPWYDGDM